jgi:glutathione S-transferase
MELELQRSAFLVADRLTLADISLLAYTRVAHEGGFDLSTYGAVKRWIAASERELKIQAFSSEVG